MAQVQFEEVKVCPYCNAPTKEGTDDLTYCSAGCGCLEGEKSLPVKHECQNCFEIVDEPKCNCK